MNILYYEAPSDAVFNEVREMAIKLWRTYDDQFGYATEKVNQIKDLQNVTDNLMYIVSMFDDLNQLKLANLLSDGAKSAIRERMQSGGSPKEYIYF